MFVFMKYHLDNGGTIPNYELFRTNYTYIIPNNDFTQDLVIDWWGLSTTEPSTASLKSTYSLSDLSTVEHLWGDIQWIKHQAPAVVTYDRTDLTAYAPEGALVYDKNDNKLYILLSGAWTALT